MKTTEEKREESVLKAAIEVNRFAQNASADELVQFTLEQGVRVTGSSIGFFHFVSADQKTIHLHSWSQNTLKQCALEITDRDYPVEKAGVWIECLHQRRPVIHNDYQNMHHKLGLPEGHVPIIRQMVVPVIEDNRVAAILGVGNRTENYTEYDVELLQLLAEHAWLVIQRRKAEEQLRNHQERLEEIVTERTNRLRLANQRLEHEIAERIGAERKRLEQQVQIEHQNASLALLKSIAATANTAHYFDSALNSVLKSICNFTGWHGGGVLIKDPPPAITIRSADIWYLNQPEALSDFQEAINKAVWRMDKGIVGKLFTQGKPIWVTDQEWRQHPEQFLLADALSASGARSLFGFPVILGAEVVAALFFASKDYCPIDKNLLNLMGDVGVQLGRVAERERARASLLESRRSLEDAQKLANVGSFQFNIQTRKMIWSKQLFRIYGLDPGQSPPMGKDHAAFMLPGDWERTSKEMSNSLKKKAPSEMEYHIRRPDGAVRSLRAFTHWAFDDHGAPLYFSGAVQDVTELRAAERALLESQSRLHAVVEDMPVMLDAFNNNGAIIYWNKECERVTGYNRDEVLNDPQFFERLYPDPDYRAFVFNMVEKHQGNFRNLEFTINCRDGSQRTISWTNVSARVPIPGWDSWAVGVDITDQKKAEEERENLSQQLLQSQKMEAIGTLAGGIAHDFNNILAAIVGYADLALDDKSEDSTLNYNIKQILQAGSRARDLVGQILTFSRRAEHEKKPMRIQSLVKEAVKLLRPSIPVTIDIQTELEDNCGAVFADATGIHQIIMNLCTNAYHAMNQNGGTLALSLKQIRLTEEQASRHLELTPGDYAELTVQDTGMGIPPEKIDRIFEPYYTTKEKGQGTGLGLAVVHSIVRSHEGAIFAHSIPGEGTTFRVYLPIFHHETREDRQRARTSSTLPQGDETILFVDDEAAIAEVSQIGLGRYGYSVVACTAAQEALELFKEQPDRFDALITDMTMPGMTGIELAQALMTLRPDLPVLMCTGYSETINEEKASQMGIQSYLIKPVGLRKMAESIRQVLDGK